MKTLTRYQFNIRKLWFCIGIMMIAGPAFGQARVKVHKDKITISAPNEQGIIHVQGQTGAIESTSEVTSLLVRNLTTNEKVLVQRLPDGSFHGEIQGETGHRLRVEARNQEAKRSIGTFDVPLTAAPAQPYAGWQIMKEVPQSTPPLPSGMPDSMPPRKAGARNLAVMVIVIDMGRGELVATERFVGVPRSNLPGEQIYSFTARNIIHKCIDAIRSELKPTVGLGGYETSNRPQQQLVPAEQTQPNISPETPPEEKPNPSRKETEEKEIETANPKTNEK